MWPTTNLTTDKKDDAKITQLRKSRSRSLIRQRHERHYEKESRRR